MCDLSISRQKSDAVIPDLFVAAKEVLLVTSDLFILRDGVIFFSLQDQQQKAVLFLRRDGGLGDELSRGFRHILASITDTSRDGHLAPTYGRVPSKPGHEVELAAHTQTLTFPFYVLSGKCPPGRNNTNTSSRTV